MILEETNIMSSRSFLGTVVFPEQVCLEPILEGGETVRHSSSVLCFTETLLSELIPDSALQLAGFKLLRADRDSLLSG